MEARMRYAIPSVALLVAAFVPLPWPIVLTLVVVGMLWAAALLWLEPPESVRNQVHTYAQ